MRGIFFLIVIFLAFVLQTRVSIIGISPNLTAALAYYFGLRNGETKGMLFGAFIGIIEDSLSGGILGPNLIGKGLVGFISSFMSGSFFRWTPVLGIIGIFFLTSFDGFVVFLSKAIFEHMPRGISNAISVILVTAVLNSLLGIFLRPRDED